MQPVEYSIAVTCRCPCGACYSYISPERDAWGAILKGLKALDDDMCNPGEEIDYELADHEDDCLFTEGADPEFLSIDEWTVTLQYVTTIVLSDSPALVDILGDAVYDPSSQTGTGMLEYFDHVWSGTAVEAEVAWSKDSKAESLHRAFPHFRIEYPDGRVLEPKTEPYDEDGFAISA